MKRLWIAIVKLFGWTFDPPNEADIPKLRHCVLIEAPHTSVYDFLLGASYIWNMNFNGRFFIKKEFFVFPIRRFLRRCGALPIDRGNRANHMVDNAVRAFAENKELTVIITPEGTRKLVRRFKKGFYEIASQAKVPIAVTYINYKTRHMGIASVIEPSGDFEADMRRILEFYEDVAPRNASGWNLDALKKTYKEKEK